jgi:hypothetical protein
MRKSEWTEQRVQRLFERYDGRFISRRLAEWKTDLSGDYPGCFGYCDIQTKRLYVRFEAHTSDRQLRATLVHEMAHASVSSRDHEEIWRLEMGRLKKAGRVQTQ